METRKLSYIEHDDDDDDIVVIFSSFLFIYFDDPACFVVSKNDSENIFSFFSFEHLKTRSGSGILNEDDDNYGNKLLHKADDQNFC